MRKKMENVRHIKFSWAQKAELLIKEVLFPFVPCFKRERGSLVSFYKRAQTRLMREMDIVKMAKAIRNLKTLVNFYP
jgi:hypothetical protein